MSNPAYVKSEAGKWAREGVRQALAVDLSELELGARVKIRTIIEAMNWPQLIVFHYGESDRVVAPFVVGVSSDGNPLLRGYQLEGNSRSGKGEGWRVFQMRKMENLENYQEFFNQEDFDFEEFYPWIYKVFKML
ncbi:MAG: hypothetical protein KJ954_13915 [Alphaproteobacteria bacterium]|nr:hypothetical protein [Alphaproteobacteria bacterium]